MEQMFHIQIYSHFFKITRINRSVLPIIMRFCAKYVIYTMGRQNQDKPDYKVFGTKTMDGSEYRFHIGQYDAFMEHVHGGMITRDQYVIEHMSLYEPYAFTTKLRDNWQLRDYQEEVVEFIVDNEVGSFNSRMIALPVGYGKTLCALAAIGRIQTRTILYILPTYIERWVKDMPNILDIDAKDILVIQGSAQLRSLINTGIANELTAKIIVISIPTMKNFLKEYEKLAKDFIDDSGYACTPDDFCKTIQAGNIIIDETHQHLHGVYKILSYTHIPKVIALSATLISEDPVLKKVQHSMFPKDIRYDSIQLDQYIKVFAISYSFRDLPSARIKTTEYGSNNYSHHAFEKSIMKNKRVLENYLDMIVYLVETSYVKEYQQGDKLGIYATSIAMCTAITEHLKGIYPQYDVRRYVEDDPYENLMDSDMRVTTILSSGVGHDISGLRAIIMTTNINSIESNVQVLGRLRKLKDRDVKFYYLYSENLPKQVKYHRNKVDLFRDKVASIKELKYPLSI